MPCLNHCLSHVRPKKCSARAHHQATGEECRSGQWCWTPRRTGKQQAAKRDQKRPTEFDKMTSSLRKQAGGLHMERPCPPEHLQHGGGETGQGSHGNMCPCVRRTREPKSPWGNPHNHIPECSRFSNPLSMGCWLPH